MNRPSLRSKGLFLAGIGVSFFLGAFVVAFFLFSAGGTYRVGAEGAMQNLEKEIQATFERTKDSVVLIKTLVPVVDVRKGEEIGEGVIVGTGFFVDAKGLILTTASTLRGAEKAMVYWRGKSYEAQCLGQDERTKVALLKIDATTPCLPSGDPETVKVGSLSLVVGYRADGPVSAEYGFISDPDATRTIDVQLFAVTHIRSSVRAQAGQSGSPLLNSKGEVIGMVVYGSQDGSSTFALPITAARKVQRDLVEHHAPRHGWTGLTIEVPASDLQNTQKRIAIRDVFSGCSAHLAGIQTGDVLKKIGNKDIQTAVDVMNATFYLSIGETVNFVVERKGETLTLPVKVMARPSDKEMLALKPVTAPSRGTP